jgi:hypothetical protein
MARGGRLQGLVVSFDTFFDPPAGSQAPMVEFSTGPDSPPTHWKQTLLWLKGAPQNELALGDVMQGSIRFKRNTTNHRSYDITVAWEARPGNQADGACIAKGEQLYLLGS